MILKFENLGPIEKGEINTEKMEENNAKRIQS